MQTVHPSAAHHLRHHPTAPARPCLEDWVGAGAIVHQLMGPRSSDARASEAAFVALRDDLEAALLDCPSGRELMARGYVADVYLAAQLDVPDAVAVPS